MSRAIKSLEHAWGAVALAFFALLCGEAWYIHQLSNRINDARIEESKALERHLSDQFQIATLKREARDCPPKAASAP